MNIIKKIYCRVFQCVFKAAIPVMPYHFPEVLYSADNLPGLLKKRKIDNVLVVTDNFLCESDIFKMLLNVLDREGIKYCVYGETVPNPTTENVEAARVMYIKNQCKGIIGFGGGSSMDCAKAVGARIVRPNKTIAQMEGIIKVLKKPPFTVGIPTTAGTGSETTPTMVICDSKTKNKFPASDFCLIPDAAVLDSRFTKTLPKHIVATTGMDALVHAVEAYIGNSTTKDTRSDALGALKLIFKNIETVYSGKDDEKAREDMLLASHLAGRAFSKSYVGYCHAVAHSLGGMYAVPHGLANAVILPYVLREYGESCHKKLWKIGVECGICSNIVSYKEGAEIFIAKICDLNKSMGIPDKLSGIKKEDIPYLAKHADKEANPLYPVPKLMDAKELEKFYIEVAE